MKVAITGGTGFIGSILAERHVRQGDEVRLLTRNHLVAQDGVKIFVGDLLRENVDLNGFLQGVDVFYHCCGELTNKLIMRELHVHGTQKLLDAASGRIGRWVQLSSVGVYGHCRSGEITEASPEQPLGEYEQTKTEADHLVRSSGVPSVTLRPSIVFGETMPNQSLFHLIRAVVAGHFFYIGKPGAILNYVHVDDVVNSLLLCGSKERALGQTFIVSQSIDIETMVNAIQSSHIDQHTIRRLPEFPTRVLAATFGWMRAFPLTTGRVNALTKRCNYDSTKIKDQLGFEFGSTLEELFQSFPAKK